MYESIEITCKVYEKVLKCLKPESTSNSVQINASKVASEQAPTFLQPFLEPLAKRAYSGLGFLINKIDEFVRVQGKSSLSLRDVMHHSAKMADFAKLKKCLEDVRASIPKGLQKNVFKYGMGEIWRALYEMSKPKRAGRNMTYEEFVGEMEQRESEKMKNEKAKKSVELGVSSCPAPPANNGNEVVYEYSNYGNNNGYQEEVENEENELEKALREAQANDN
jgi:hypothetical protein